MFLRCGWVWGSWHACSVAAWGHELLAVDSQDVRLSRSNKPQAGNLLEGVRAVPEQLGQSMGLCRAAPCSLLVLAIPLQGLHMCHASDNASTSL